VVKRSKQAANMAMATLESAGVLTRTSLAKRNRGWEAKEVFELLNGFERELASPTQGMGAGRASPYPGRGQSKSR
jgi:hypothetical protein